MSTNHENLIDNLVNLLEKGNAHASLEKALEAIPYPVLGERPQNVPYSLWQLAEHIRIAQWDILEFSKSPEHGSPKWPEEYWPMEPKPSSESEWKKCVNAIEADKQGFIDLIKNADDHLYKPFEHGTGQSLLKEALVLADHNSYHAGEIILLRRLLGVWN